MQVDNPFADGQTQTTASQFSGPGFIHPVKTVKNPDGLFLGNPNSGITNFNGDPLFIGKQVNMNVTAWFIILYCNYTECRRRFCTQ